MAKKKSVDPRAFALDALSKSVGDSSAKVLFGTKATPGFFSGNTAKTRSASEFCIQQGWLADTGMKTGSGRSEKSLYRITPNGIQAVLDENPALQVLESLQNAVDEQKAKLQAATECMKTMNENLERVADVVAKTIDRVKPPDVATIFKDTNGTARRNGEQWYDEIVRRASNTDPYHPLEIPKLYESLKSTNPSLTIGEFHDGLRRLNDEKRIRLLPYTRSYASIAGDREPFFLDGEVIYYVRGA